MTLTFYEAASVRISQSEKGMMENATIQSTNVNFLTPFRDLVDVIS